MFSNRIVVVVVAAACVVSAGAGSYFATRQNVAGVASPTAAASSATASAVAPVSTEPLDEATPAVDARATARPPAGPAPSAPARASAGPRARAAGRPAVAPVPRTDEPARAVEPAPPAVPNAGSAPTADVAPAAEQAATPADVEEQLPSEPATAPLQAARNFEELVVAADSVIGLETETVLSSATARLEDRVEARVVRDVRVGGQVAIPAGTRAVGNVVVVEHGGRFRERARLGIRFRTLMMADGSQVPIDTDTIYRFGSPPGNASAQRIGGGAVIGAIIGGIMGGGKGAAIGATAGAGAGTASVMTSDRSEAVFPAGAEVTARVLDPIVVTVEKD